jgi:hypothetical protein
MLAEDAMTINERRKSLQKLGPRYLHADRAGRSHLLSDMEQVTGLHRKRRMRLLTTGSLERRNRTTPRRRRYGPDVAYVVEVGWESLDDLCAERLTPTLLPPAQPVATCGARHLTAQLEAQRATLSRATGQRLLSTLRRAAPRLPRKGPEQAHHLRKMIPLER